MALHFAAHQGHADVVEVLLRHGQDGMNVAVKGRSPLHDVANNGHHEVLQLLVDYQADLTATSFEGFTALHFAARGNHVEVASSILQADKSSKFLGMKSRSGTTALEDAERE